MTLGFIIPGKPKPLKRHRHGQGHGYNDPEVTAKKDEVAWIARSAMARQKFAMVEKGPVHLTIYLCWPSPAPWPKTFTRDPAWRPSVPDRDNCEKLIADALNGVAWKDDSQVCAGEVVKLTLPSGEEPFTLVRVTPLTESPTNYVEIAMQMRDELEMGRQLP